MKSKEQLKTELNNMLDEIYHILSDLSIGLTAKFDKRSLDQIERVRELSIKSKKFNDKIKSS